MDRRTFLGILAGGLLAPLSVEGQPPGKMFKLGLLGMNPPSGQPPAGPGSGAPVVDALRGLGYIEGRNIVIERRYSEGILERLPGLAAELVALKPDVIFAQGAAQAQAVKRATATIPIVAASGDLVALGLVASLARPGGNVTGLDYMQFDIAGKRLALLKEAIPGLSRVGLLFATDVTAYQRFYDITSSDTQRVALTLGLTLQIVHANDPIGLDTAFGTPALERAQAVLIPSTQLAVAQRRQLADLASKHRMALAGDERLYAEAGFFLSYGANGPEFIRHAATYIDKILRGAKPADLPVERPTKLELIINMKTARALNLTIAPSLLLRADQVIE